MDTVTRNKFASPPTFHSLTATHALAVLARAPPSFAHQSTAAQSNQIKEVIMNFIKITTLLGLVTACSNITPLAPATQPAESQVVFICEHGNVKSLMASNYFNQLAQQKGLSIRSISRGTDPDSTTVPAPIIAGLKQDGFDVSTYRPVKLSAEEVAKSQRVILINAQLPETLGKLNGAKESWEDVPPASINFAASSKSLKQLVEKLIEE
ncbi:MAG: hypothetical protein RL020_2013, partial [Pseudomonadota bacterium]